jgi:NAD(P)-dependent dehydrogenase (short-subunit alcohol dehydrogenase family)
MARYALHGKAALITGGAQGIGFGIASALTRRGARVALVDLDPDSVGDAAAALGADNAIAVTADVTNSDAMDTAVAAAVDRFGGIDVVVANAGIAPQPASMRVMARAEFERVVEVDLLGVYRTVRAGIGQIVERRGHAVLVSSIYAFVNGMLVSPYAVSKAGVEQLGRALRVELAPHGASATVAYFAFVDTPMLTRALQQSPAVEQAQGEIVPAFLRKTITPQRAGEAVARAIERRQPRVIAPRYWAAMSVLRGVTGPALDYFGTRYSRIQSLLQETEKEGTGAHRLLEEGTQEEEETDPA